MWKSISVTGNVSETSVYGSALGTVADTVPDAIARRPATLAPGIVERVVPPLFGAMVSAVGSWSHSHPEANESPTTAAAAARWNQDDAGG